MSPDDPKKPQGPNDKTKIPEKSPTQPNPTDRTPETLPPAGDSVDSISVPPTLEALPPESKALALLGARKEIQAYPRVPIISITYPSSSEQQVQQFLKSQRELALPLSPNPILRTNGNKKGLRTIPLFTQYPTNASLIFQAAQKQGLLLKVSVPKHLSTMLKLGQTALPIDPKLKCDPQKDITETEINSDDEQVDGIKCPTPQPFSENFLTANSLNHAQKGSKNIEDIQPGNYDAMVIDLSHIGEITNKQDQAKPLAKISDNLRSLIDSPKYHVISDDQGNLVVLTKLERGGNALGELAIKLFPCAPNKLSLTFAKISINKDAYGNITTNDYPNVGSISSKKTSGLWMTKSQFENFQYRDSTDVTFKKLSYEDDPNDPDQLIPITVEYTQRAEEKQTGPREVIGYTKERKAIKQALSHASPTKLLIIEGKGGTGKTRLYQEATKNNPNIATVRISESCIYTPGKGLAVFAEKLHREALRMIPKSKNKQRAAITSLTNFVRFTEEAKLKMAQSPNGQKDLQTACVKTLQAMAEAAENTEINPFIFGIDDNHFIDRLSVATIAKIKYQYLKTVPNGKLVFLERPEQGAQIETRTAKSYERKLLERLISQEFGPKTVEIVALQNPDGTPKVDFSDPKTSEKYVLKSLPQTLIDPQATPAGEWAKKIGQKAGSGLEMDIAIRLIQPHIIYDPTTHKITVSDKGMESINQMAQAETLERFLSEKLEAQELNESEQDFIADLAVSEGFLTLQQLISLNHEKHPNEHINIKRLENIGFIKTETTQEEETSHQTKSVNFFHPNFESTIRNKLTSKERADRAKTIFEKYKEELSPEGKLRMLEQFIDLERNPKSWHLYELAIKDSLYQSQHDNNHNKEYEIAIKVLGKLNVQNPKRTTTKYLQKLHRDTRTEEKNCPPASIIPILQETLQSLIRGSFYKGNFDKIHLAIELLQKLEESTIKHRTGRANPIGNPQLKRMLRIGYDAAYTEAHEYGDKRNILLMKKYKKAIDELDSLEEMEIKETTSEGTSDTITVRDFEKEVMELQMIYRTQGPASCYQAFSNPSDEMQELLKERYRTQSESIKLRRLICRVRVERINKLMESKRGVDGNAIFGTPEALEEDLTAELIDLSKEIEKLLEDIEKNPTALNLIEEFSLQEIHGEILAYKCLYDKSSETFGTEWLEASRVGSIHEAARAALLCATTLYTKALVGQITTYPKERSHQRPGQASVIIGQVTPRSTDFLHPKSIQDANKTMDAQAIPALKELEESDFNQVLIRALRVRGSALLAQAYKRDFFGKHQNEGRKAEILEDLRPDLITGLECLKQIHEFSQFKKYGIPILTKNIPNPTNVNSIITNPTTNKDQGPSETSGVVLVDDIAQQLHINSQREPRRYQGLSQFLPTLMEACYYIAPYGNMLIDQAVAYKVITPEKAQELRKSYYMVSDSARKLAQIHMQHNIDQEKVALGEPLRKSKELASMQIDALMGTA